MEAPDDRGGVPRAQSEAPSPPPPPRGQGGQPQGGGDGGEDGGNEEEEEDEEDDDDEEDGVTRRKGRLDPTLFSFWLAANLPLDDDARQQLLLLDSVVMRLR